MPSVDFYYFVERKLKSFLKYFVTKKNLASQTLVGHHPTDVHIISTRLTINPLVEPASPTSIQKEPEPTVKSNRLHNHKTQPLIELTIT